MAGGKHEIITTRLNALAAYLLAIRGWGVSPMSSTLEIIHKYHIISAQISAWEKPF